MTRGGQRCPPFFRSTVLKTLDRLGLAVGEDPPHGGETPFEEDPSRSLPHDFRFSGYTVEVGRSSEGPGSEILRREARAVIVATSPEPPTIAVAIPCYNEAGAVESVVAEWRTELPEAEIVVFDNNSNDGTGAIARRLGVRVVEVREQGKGHAVLAIFEDLADRDAVIMVDGDGTYPASAARALLESVLDGRADMAVGNRKPVAELGAMSPIRGFGNVLIGAAFALLIGPGTRDLLSGYRVFSRHFRRVVIPRSSGFEIEAELVSQAVARGLRVVEVDVPYRPRIAGTASKLRAFRDGRRILVTILRQSLRFRPWRPATLLAVPILIVGLALGSWPVIVAGGCLLIAGIAPAPWMASPRS